MRIKFLKDVPVELCVIVDRTPNVRIESRLGASLVILKRNSSQPLQFGKAEKNKASGMAMQISNLGTSAEKVGATPSHFKFFITMCHLACVVSPSFTLRIACCETSEKQQRFRCSNCFQFLEIKLYCTPTITVQLPEHRLTMMLLQVLSLIVGLVSTSSILVA